MLEHFYQRVPGFFSFQPVYDLALARIPDRGVWVEVGSWQGRSISYAVVESLRQARNIQFHVVDIWRLAEKHHRPGLQSDQDLYEAFCRNTETIQDHFTVHRQASDVAATEFADHSLDFLMIDADHSYEAVARDIRAWWPKMRPGALMTGDDLRGSFPGVRQAITEFAQEHHLTWRGQSGCWIVECPC
jgi:hypothetical protein